MGRVIALLYGLVAYVAFAATIIYSIGFVTGLVVPKTIDSGPAGPPLQAIIVNLLLMSLFAVQHSVMARPQFKKWWTRIVPAAVERSTFVLFSSLALAFLFWQWQPIPAVVWQVTNPQVATSLLALSLFGWASCLSALSLSTTLNSSACIKSPTISSASRCRRCASKRRFSTIWCVTRSISASSYSSGRRLS